MNSVEIHEVSVDQILHIRHQVLWPDKSPEFVKVPEDENGVHFGAYLDGNLVSVISLFKDTDSIRFRKFATLPAYQGKGLGSMLLQHSIDFAKQKQFRRMWCDARADALGFYNRFGFVTFSEPFFKENIEYYKIEKMI